MIKNSKELCKMEKKPVIIKVERKVGRYGLNGRSALLIDSGLGLLSVAKSIHSAYPDMRLFGISDQKGFPWGPRQAADLISRCLTLAQKGLKETGAEALVLACNTASTVAIDALRDALDIPVVGVIPAIKPAAHMTKTGHIGLLATEGTIKRAYIDGLIEEFAADCHVIKVGSKNLAALAEDKIQGKNLDYEAIAQNLRPFEDEKVDIIALGCTHYPLLSGELEALAEREMQFLDTGSAVARQLARKLAEIEPKQGKNKKEACLYYTGEGYDINPAILASFGFMKTAFL